MSRRNDRGRKRRRNRGRFGPLFKLLCVAALLVALTAGATVFFRVEHIIVDGNARYTQEEVVAASGIQLGDNLYGLNKLKIDSGIRAALPYIGDLTIRRALPSTIVITITEWEAVARVAAPTPERARAAQEEAREEDEEAEPLELAKQSWLISTSGKLLEPAPAGSSLPEITGLTPIAPQAGELMVVPEGERFKLESLLALLAAMDEAEAFPQVSAIRMGATQIELRYLDRFDVKMELNGDFRYDIQVVRKVREEIENRHGPEAAGAIDLTQDGYVGYSPLEAV